MPSFLYNLILKDVFIPKMHSEERGTKTEHDHHGGVLRWSRRLEAEQPDSYDTNKGQRGRFGGTT